MDSVKNFEREENRAVKSNEPIKESHFAIIIKRDSIKTNE